MVQFREQPEGLQPLVVGYGGLRWYASLDVELWWSPCIFFLHCCDILVSGSRAACRALSNFEPEGVFGQCKGLNYVLGFWWCGWGLALACS